MIKKYVGFSFVKYLLYSMLTVVKYKSIDQMKQTKKSLIQHNFFLILWF